MKLHEMKPLQASQKRNRVGRGPGSGNGKTLIKYGECIVPEGKN